MRWLYLVVVVVFVVAILVFALQNLEMVTMSFLGANMTAPLAVTTVVAYVLGAITGGSAYALLRKSIQAART